MEQARRSALAHHVHRTAPMGPRVLINGIWYYASVFRHRPRADVGWSRSAAAWIHRYPETERRILSHVVSFVERPAAVAFGAHRSQISRGEHSRPLTHAPAA